MLIAHRILLIIIITEFCTQIAKCDGALKISTWCMTSRTPWGVPQVTHHIRIDIDTKIT